MFPKIAFFIICISQFGYAQPGAIVLFFQVRNNLIVFQGTVDNKIGYFILDTGVKPLVLNRRYFRGEPSSKNYIGVDGRPNPAEERTVDLEIGVWKLSYTHADITDLRALEVHTGLPIYGIGGGRIIKNCELVIDYTFKELTIYLQPQKNQWRALHAEAEEVLSFRFKGAMPAIDVRIGEQALRFGLDRGASDTVLDQRHQDDLQDRFIAREEKELATFGNRTATTIGGTLDNLFVGNQSCPPMPTLIVSLDGANRQLAGPRLDGLLGFHFLSRYRTAISFKSREVHLWSPQTVLAQYYSKLEGGNRKAENRNNK